MTDNNALAQEVRELVKKTRILMGRSLMPENLEHDGFIDTANLLRQIPQMLDMLDMLERLSHPTADAVAANFHLIDKANHDRMVKSHVEAERERCARIAEAMASSAEGTLRPDTGELPRAAVCGNISAGRYIAAAIRSGGAS